MSVRSGVTVKDTSHLCQLNALMSPVCMQRATLKVITWSLVWEQEVPLQQTLRLKVHSHRFGAIATVAEYSSFPLFPFPQYFLGKEKVWCIAYIFIISKFVEIVSWKRNVQPQTSKYVLAHFIREVLSEEAILVGNTPRVDSSQQLCTASTETMTFKYTSFLKTYNSLHFSLPFIQTKRASVRSRDKTTNLSRYCAPTRGKNGCAKKKKNTCNPACPVVCILFFTRGFPFHALKYWSNTVFFMRGLSCVVDTYIINWLRKNQIYLWKPKCK